MSQVWDAGPSKQGHLLVMLALADYANDTGECWPSIKSIAEKARMTERGVQKIIRALEADGWVEIDTGNGRKGCNQYRINPERSSPPEHSSPRTTVQKTPNDDAETPNVGTPEPLRTIKEPSSIEEAREIKAHLLGFCSDRSVDSFIRFRKRIKKPLTVIGAERIAKKLAAFSAAGHSPDDALGMAEEKGWQSIELSWYEKTINGGQNGQPASKSKARMAAFIGGATAKKYAP